MRVTGITENEHELTRYLLGELSEKEQALVEERFLADDDFYEQMLALEDELTYDYAQGVLPESERAAFEQRFLAGAEDHRRVTMARALLERLAPAGEEGQLAPDLHRPKKGSWFHSLIMFFSAGLVARPVISYSLATALAVLLAFSAWLIVRNKSKPLSGALEAQQGPGKANSQKIATVEHTSGEQPPQVSSFPDHLGQQSAIPKLTPPPTQPQPAIKNAAPTPIISLVLSPGLVRGGSEARVLHLNQSSGTVELLLTLKNTVEYKTFAAVFLNVEGQRIWRRAGLRANPAGAATIPVRVPASVLSEGDYEIELSGLSSSGESQVADYYFTVLKRR